MNKKHLIRIFLAFKLIMISIVLNAQSNLSALVQKSKPSIFRIVTYNSEGKELASGTGFFIGSKGIGVTNYHVLAGASKATIKTLKGQIYSINKIISESENLDLIKFSINNPNNIVFPFLASSLNKPNEGENVFTIGNPEGLEYSVSNGIVSSVRNDKDFGQIIQTTTPISHGNSGSPLINMQGEVVGIISFTLIEGQNLNFAIGVSNLKLLPVVNSLKFPSQLSKEEAQSTPKYRIQEFQRFIFGCAKSYVSNNVNDPKDNIAQTMSDAISSQAPQFTSLAYKTKLCSYKANVRYDFEKSVLNDIVFSSGCLDYVSSGKPNSCSEENLKVFIEFKNILTSLIGNSTICSPCVVCSTKPIKVPTIYSDAFKNLLISLGEEYPENCTICLSWFDYTNNSTISLSYRIDDGWFVQIKSKEY